MGATTSTAAKAATTKRPATKTPATRKTATKKAEADAATWVVLVVDRSGSMMGIDEDMEGGIASLLAEQAAQEGSCLVTLAQFDDQYELLADGVPAAEVAPYRLVPRGSTALLDAIGRTVSHVKACHDALVEAERPEHVVLCVVTDGCENASREWSAQQIHDAIVARRAEGWEVTFLGANQDAVIEGGKLGVDVEASLTYDASSEGTTAAFTAMSQGVADLRGGRVDAIAYSPAQRDEALGR